MASSGPERPGWLESGLTLNERLEALGRGSNRLSVGYAIAAWISVAAAIFLWEAFLLPAIGFYLGAILLRREGL